ncbi:hypothetical protein ABW02_23085 [Niallia circulans]|uniref:RsfA family transcriptional regulator n=1 Tax=Niallia circulans TaxID=1397 RepID=A0A0J1I6H7_NIACI|nr:MULTISPECIES: RsfA family transcriptional regulator [Niallia]EOR22139.1 spore coat protein regulator protein YlbO [Niallia nealsonii AAU1]SLL37521.1 Prespore-specific transcriptional regulator rsfA [Mycobacteroides abscessus subsp. abscessus]HEO8422559.1 RsfA family transcriptional regulator [Yersinia enterocolitica]KLV21564.1 hypothetical protein ABW02_23085 [Niallia circulans]MCB5237283.1 RsfA family transcriptional regulator [Niallia circulans]
MSTRQNGWTKDEDLLLAETVIQFIKDGRTQLQAFEEVGKQLTRTSAACGFRWNSAVRKQHESAIKTAKEHRKQLKKGVNIETSVITIQESEQSPIKSGDDFEQILAFIKDIYNKSKIYEEQAGLLEKIKELDEENNRLQNELISTDEAYQAIVELMEKAREMVLSK